MAQVAETLVRQRRARELMANAGDESDRKRYDTYVGRYMTGRYVPEADIPMEPKGRKG